MHAEDEGAVRSVLRTFDLLALFTERTRTWAVKDLTTASGLAKTTLLRLVATCEQRGLLWTRPDGRITVGPGMLRWAQLANTAWQLPEPVRQVLAGGAEGAAVCHGEPEQGASSVAAPVHDGDGRVLAALAITGPSSRFGSAEVAALSEAVAHASRRISRIGLGTRAE